MKLAVMMAAWNAEAYIPYALNSILSQGDEIDLDVIIVNDGSTDQTGAIIDQLAASDPRVRAIHTANQGVTRARNEALRAISPDTDLVTFLDSDDLVPQGRYQRDLELFRSDASLQVIFGNSVWFREANDDQTGPAAGLETFSGRGVQLAAGTYRYDTIKSLGEFDVSFKQAEDMDFILRLFETAPIYRIVDTPFVYYRRHAHNMTHDLAQVKRDFARALMMSMRRRKGGKSFSYPAGLFDVQGLVEAYQW